MRLLCDIGNTRLKWAVEEAAEFIEVGDCLNQELADHSNYADFIPITSLDSIWVSCVGAEHVFERFKKWARDRFGLTVNRVGVTQAACDIDNGYAEQQQLGVDRWVAALGVRKEVAKGDVIIVDAGTAVTIDILDRHNVFRGGAILPGLTLMHDSLVQRTAGIHSQRVDSPPVVGRNTIECVNSGVHYGFVGAVDHVIHMMLQQYSRKATIVVTGGDSEWLLKNSNSALQLSRNLVLKGLLALAQRV